MKIIATIQVGFKLKNGIRENNPFLRDKEMIMKMVSRFKFQRKRCTLKMKVPNKRRRIGKSILILQLITTK
jgi:hypothetical protein